MSVRRKLCHYFIEVSQEQYSSLNYIQVGIVTYQCIENTIMWVMQIFDQHRLSVSARQFSHSTLEKVDKIQRIEEIEKGY